MGKSGKKKKGVEKQRRLPHHDGCDELPSSAYDVPHDQEECSGGAEEEDEAEDSSGGGYINVGEKETSTGSLSKFDLYQQSVQSPKGDITYLQKFFLMYVGGRRPLHLQEDFCGTALLSSEWLRSDPRRTAVGLDLDLEALNWCLEKNVTNISSDRDSRISLFHGNVLHPHKAHKVEHQGQDHACSTMEEASLPLRDIICAFNYSCCCLQRRVDLVRYFKNALTALSNKGGIFVMDLYGGTSSERKLRLQRKFSNFTYIWEQGEFDIISRRTRISLHFQLGKMGMLRHAFSYDWRLWSLPEITDCMEEAGFQSIHFWIREMPSTQENEHCEEYNADGDVKYEDLATFRQQDSWNAYVVGVANL